MNHSYTLSFILLQIVMLLEVFIQNYVNVLLCATSEKNTIVHSENHSGKKLCNHCMARVKKIFKFLQFFFLQSGIESDFISKNNS